MKNIQKQSGFTLIELMITVAIIGTLSAIAIPVYEGYVRNSKMATALENAQGLAGFQDTYFYENGTYLAGTYTTGVTGFTNALEWMPAGDNGLFKYVVAAGPCGDITQCYTVTVNLISDPSITQSVSR